MAQAHTILISAITQTTCTISWTRGDGSAVAVFVKQGESGYASPVNNTSYAANTVFGSGTQIGSTGWYCTYNGTGTTVNITGLTPGTAYIAHAIEYSGGLGSETYQTDVPIYNPWAFSTVAETQIACAAVVAGTDNWALGAGSDKVSAVALPHDDDTSYIVSTGSASVQEFSPQPHSIPAGSRIVSVRVVRRHKRDGASNGAFSTIIALGGFGTTGGSASSAASYTTATTAALARPGGGDWTPDNILDVRIRFASTSANHTRITTAYLLVEYLPFQPLRQWQRNWTLLLD